LVEFTGERVIPEKVDVDLWNEHRARYLFAARLGGRKRILDLGCGTGYGTAELAASARCVVGVDRSAEAIAYANGHYHRRNTRFVISTAEDLPLANAAFDLVVAFELIEHLPECEALLGEVKRVLAPKGQFIVSTPNRAFYAESRRLSGPNPYHAHEFDFAEFRKALASYFPFVSLFLQNHSSGVVFYPVEGDSTAEVRVDRQAVSSDESNFFVAVCALTPQLGAPTFVHIPTAANVLRERSEHIRLLEEELRAKNTWLEAARKEHQELVDRFRRLEQEIEERNRWADSLNKELSEARADIDRLNTELAERSDSYEAKISELERENETHIRWARDTNKKLDEKIQELAHCVDVLHQTEKTVEERTVWAQTLSARVERLELLLGLVEGSRWFKLGRAFGLGPELRQK
jgi:SAM-dependent methyltransferase